MKVLRHWDSAVLLQGTDPSKSLTPMHQEACTTMFIAAYTVQESQKLELIYVSIAGRIDKLLYVLLLSCYAAVNMNVLLPHETDPC